MNWVNIVKFAATSLWYGGVGVFLWWLAYHYLTCATMNGWPVCFLHDFK